MRFRAFLLLLFPAFLCAEIGYVEPWGKDAKLQVNPPTSLPQHRPLSPMGKLAEQVILFHHNVLTHTTGPRSHFRPTSSQYMLEAIRTYGFCQGYIMGCDRLLRENAEVWCYRTKLVNGNLYKWDSPKRPK